MNSCYEPDIVNLYLPKRKNLVVKNDEKVVSSLERFFTDSEQHDDESRCFLNLSSTNEE